jgi:Asp-tRNA(Asn)/Glu-tRNA(Gln) amidotransferase A subunit family amidase
MILLMRGLTGKTEFNPEARPDQAVSIGLYRTSDWSKAPAYVHDCYEQTAEYLGRAGCPVRDVRLPTSYDELREALEIVQLYESARSFEWELKCRRDDLEPGLAKLLEDGWAIPRDRYLWAVAAGEACRKRFADDISDVELLMVPGAAMEAPKATYVGSNDFIDMWMLLYVPDVALSVGKGPNGLPLGVQLIGRQGDDARHLVRATRIEEILRQRV